MAKKRRRIRRRTESERTTQSAPHCLLVKSKPRRIITRRKGTKPRVYRRKLTVKARKIIYAAVENGLPIHRCHDLIGVSNKRFGQWLEYGRDPSYPLYYFFVKKLYQIKKQKELDALKIINNSSKGGWIQTITKVKQTKNGMETEHTEKTIAPQWQAAAWLLERLYKDTYGREKIQLEKTPEEFAREIHEATSVLFNSVPVKK